MLDLNRCSPMARDWLATVPPDSPEYGPVLVAIRSRLRAGESARSLAVEFLGMADRVADLFGLAPLDPLRRRFRALVGDLIRQLAAERPQFRVVGWPD